MTVRRLVDDCGERLGELVAFQHTTRKEIESGKEVLQKLKEKKEEVAQQRVATLARVEEYYRLASNKLNEKEAEMVAKMKGLEEGYSCIEEALYATNLFKNIMKNIYKLMMKATNMVSGLGHLFGDTDAKSTTSMRSEKEKRLEAAMQPWKGLSRSRRNCKERRSNERESKRERKET